MSHTDKKVEKLVAEYKALTPDEQTEFKAEIGVS